MNKHTEATEVKWTTVAPGQFEAKSNGYLVELVEGDDGSGEWSLFDPDGREIESEWFQDFGLAEQAATEAIRKHAPTS